MTKGASVVWNPHIRLAFSDVDETIAEVYTPAEPAMIAELSVFLKNGGALFLVTGGSLQRVCKDITDLIEPALRRRILVSHCSGAEVWGFMDDGNLREDPFYSEYQKRFTSEMKQDWRQCITQLIQEFSLRPHPAQPKTEFWATIGHDPMDIMLDDRGPQITMEVVNAIDLTHDQVSQLPYDIPLTHDKYDLRTAVKNRAIELFTAHNIPITPRFGGNFALDFAIEGISKTTSIVQILSDTEVLSTINIAPHILENPENLEISGDKFSTINGGTDRHMCQALDPQIRAIDFRQEDPAELPDEFSIVLWDGDQHLHHGLLQYLQSRHG